MLRSSTGAPVLAEGPHRPARPLRIGEVNPLDASGDVAFAPDVLLKDGVRIIAAKPKDIPAALRGQRGEIRSAVVIFDEGGEARVAGPVSLDSTGLLDGDITVTFKDGDKLGQALARAIPEAASVIKPALSAAALAAGKDKEASLILTIRKGRISAGFIPIGNIPAL